MAKNHRAFLGNSSFEKSISSLDDRNWERYFESLTQPYAREEQAISTQRAYDYTQAYSNYMAAQRQIANTNIFSGQKEDILQQAKDSYSQSTQQADAEYSQRLAQTISGYQKVAGEATEAFDQEVDSYGRLLESFFKHQGLEFNPTDNRNYIRDNETGKYRLANEDESGAIKFFDRDEDTGEFVSTDHLKRMVEEELYSEKRALEDDSFLRELKRNNPELYNFFLTKQSNVNELVGLDREDRAFTEEEWLTYAKAGMSEEFLESVDNSLYFNVMYSDEKSKAEFLDASRGKDPSFRGNVGSSKAAWGNIIPGGSKVNFTVGKLNLRKNDNKISEDVYKFVKEKFSEGVFVKNDIFEYNGKLYVAESDKHISELETLPGFNQSSGFGGGGGRAW